MYLEKVVLTGSEKGASNNVEGAFFELLIDGKMVMNRGRLGKVPG